MNHMDLRKTYPSVRFQYPHKLSQVGADCISSVRFSPQGSPITLVGATSWDSSCLVWQLATDSSGAIQSRPLASTNHDAPLLSLSFSTDGRAFFSGCSNNAVMWNLTTNQKSVVATHEMPISCVSYINGPGISQEMLMTGGWDGLVKFWDLRQRNPIRVENLEEPVFAMDAQKTLPMASVATGRKIHIFNLTNGQKAAELLPSSVTKFNIRCLACSPQLDGVVLGTSEGRISFVGMEQNQNLPSKSNFTIKAHSSIENGITFMYQANFVAHHPTLPFIFSGGGDGRIVVSNRDKRIVDELKCSELAGDKPISIASGDLYADGSMLAYAYSYDWSLGQAGYQKQPNHIHIRAISS